MTEGIAARGMLAYDFLSVEDRFASYIMYGLIERILLR